MSADHVATLDAFVKANNDQAPAPLRLPTPRCCPSYDALVTDDKSPIFRYAKRAYFILDKNGVVR